MHASMPPKRTSKRLRGYPPELQERVEVGNADEEASPPSGSARVDCHNTHCSGDSHIHSEHAFSFKRIGEV